MAITQRAVGSWVASNATTQTVTLPTHAAGDMLILRAVCKPFGAAIVCNTSGWAAVAAQNTNGSTANGVGVGSMAFRAFYKIATSAAETDPVITWGTTSAPGAGVAASYQKASTEDWVTPVGDGGGDTTARTSQTSTIDTHVSVVSGDLVDFYRAMCDDSGTLTVPTITQTGITYDTVTESPAAALSSGTSNDISVDGGYRTATSGTSSAAAVVTGTSSSSEEHGAWMTRLRVVQAVTLPLLDNSGGSGGGGDYPTEVLADSPSWYHRLGEPSGTTANDESTNNRDATYTNTGNITYGVAGAITGDADDAVTFATSGLVSNTNTITLTDFSIEAWIKRYRTGTGYDFIFYSRGPTSGTVTQSVSLDIGGTTNDKVEFYFTSGAATIESTTLLDSTSVWYHVVGTYDATAHVAKVYVNGSDVSVLSSGTVPTGNTISSAFNIGNDPGPTHPAGTLDEVSLYPTVLSAARVLAHYNAGTGGGAPSNLYEPTVAQVTSQTITLGLLDAAPALYAPAVQPDQFLTVPLLDAAPALYAPTITTRNTLTVPLLDAAPALYAPTVIIDQFVTLGLLDAAPALYAPTVAGVGGVTQPLALPTTGGTAYPTEVLADTPVLYWRLGEPSGTTATDASGNSRPGTYAGVDVLLGEVGPLSDGNTAVKFGPTSGSKVSRADEAALDLGDGPFTIEFWAKRATAGTSGYIFGKGTGAYQGYFASIDDKFHFEVANTQATAQESGTTDTAWHHWAIVQGSGSTDAIIYKDGVNVTTVNNTTTFTNTATALEVAGVTGQTQFDGWLDDFALYNTALSGARVAAHYAATGGQGTPVLYAPTVVAKNTFTVPLLDAAPALYAPLLYQDQFLTPPLLDAVPALYAPTISSASSITLGLLDAANALYAPLLYLDQFLTVPLLDAAPALYAPTIGTGNSIVLALLDGAPSLYAPTITTGSVGITLALLDAGPTLYAPTLISGAVGITLGLLDAGPTLYAPLVYQDQFVTVPVLDAANALYAPTVAPVVVAYAAAVLADAPVAYWRLGEASGNPQDSVGTNHVTVVGGTPTYGVAGALIDGNTAITFDGSTEYFTAPDATALDLGDGPWTIEFWAKRASSGTAYRQIIDKGVNSPSIYFDITSNKLAVERSDVAVNVNETGSTTDTNWHHFVVVRPAGGPTVLYKDTTNVTNLVGAVTYSNTTTAFHIGAYATSGPRFFFHGSLDEVAVYNTALSAARVLAHYNAATSTTQSIIVPLLTSTSALYAPTLTQTGTLAVTLGLLDGGAALYAPVVGRVGTTYYIATTGNDSTGNGSIGTPWRTLLPFIGQFGTGGAAVAGDTLLVRGGTYSGSDIVGGDVPSSANYCELPGTAAAPITIKAYPGETPIFDNASQTHSGGANNAYIWIRYEAAYITFEGLRFDWDGSVFAIGNDTSGSRGYPHHITVRNCTINQRAGTNHGHHGLYLSNGSHDCLFEFNDLGGGSNTGNGAGIECFHTPNPYSNTIRFNLIHHWYYGVQMWDEADSGTMADYDFDHNTLENIGNIHYYFHNQVNDIRITNSASDSSGTDTLFETGAFDITQTNDFWNQTFLVGHDLAAGQTGRGGASDGSDSGARQGLILALLDGAPALYAPTLIRVAVTLSPPLLDSGSALYAPQVQPDQFVTVPLLDAANALYAPAVGFTLTVPLLTSTATLYAPTIAATNTLTPPLLDAASALYAPTISAGNALTVPLLDAVNALYAPVVSPDQFLTVPLLDAANALYAPVLYLDQFLTVPLLDAVPALYAPTLTVGAVGITVPLLDAGPALYAPTVIQDQFLDVPFLDAAAALYSPTLTVQAVTLTVPLLDAAPAVYAPTLIQDQFVTLGLLDAGPALYAPTVIIDQFVTLGLLDAANAVYAPALTVGAITFIVPLIDGAPALYAPSFSGTTNASFTANAVVKQEQLGTFTINAFVAGVGVFAFAIDSVVKKTITGTLTADALITRLGSGTFTVNAIVKTTPTPTFTIDAVVKRTEARTFDAQAIVNRTATATLTIDAFLLKVSTATFTVDAVQKKTASSSFTVDAVIRDTRTAGVTIDAVIVSPRTGSFTLNAVIFGQQQRQFVADAVLQKTVQGQLTLDARLLKPHVGSFLLDAWITPEGYSFTVDAIVRVPVTGSFVAAAYLVPQPTQFEPIVALNSADLITSTLAADLIAGPLESELIEARWEEQ